MARPWRCPGTLRPIARPLPRTLAVTRRRRPGAVRRAVTCGTSIRLRPAAGGGEGDHAGNPRSSAIPLAAIPSPTVAAARRVPAFSAFTGRVGPAGTGACQTARGRSSGCRVGRYRRIRHGRGGYACRTQGRLQSVSERAATPLPHGWRELGYEKTRPPVSPGESGFSTVGVAGFEPTTSSSRTKHATKLRHTPCEATTAYRTAPQVSQTHCLLGHLAGAGARLLVDCAVSVRRHRRVGYQNAHSPRLPDGAVPSHAAQVTSAAAA